MKKLLIISIWIVLASCGQTTKSDHSNQTDKLINTATEIETANTEQQIAKENISESIYCPEVYYNSTKQQADALVSFMKKANDSSKADRILWEKKFFCAFPNSFKGMQLLFGYDDTNGAAPLYATEKETYSYTDKHIMSDVIGFFSELKSIPDSTYYEKYIRINIDGYWEADNINEAFGFYYPLMNQTATVCKTLAKFSDKDIQTVFRFMFDGPHPKNTYNEKRYNDLKPKIESENERLSLLFTASYHELMAEVGEH